MVALTLECLEQRKKCAVCGFRFPLSLSLRLVIGHPYTSHQSFAQAFSLFFSLHTTKVYRRWWRWLCAWAAAAVCWWRLSTTATTASGATPARSKSWIAVSAGSFNPVSNVRDMANAKLLVFCFVVAPPENRLLGLGDKSRNVMICMVKYVQIKKKWGTAREAQAGEGWKLKLLCCCCVFVFVAFLTWIWIANWRRTEHLSLAAKNKERELENIFFCSLTTPRDFQIATSLETPCTIPYVETLYQRGTKSIIVLPTHLHRRLVQVRLSTIRYIIHHGTTRTRTLILIGTNPLWILQLSNTRAAALGFHHRPQCFCLCMVWGCRLCQVFSLGYHVR